MTAEMRKELTPQQYIRQLFADTKDGKLQITYYYPFDYQEPYTLTYAMDWTEADVETMLQRYETLTAMLRKIAQLEDRLQEEENRKALLTPEEQRVWDIFIRPFSPFEVDEEEIKELYYRGEFDTLDDEENALLERHWWWREGNTLERLPFLRRSPTSMILYARRYEALASLHAPQLLIEEAGRWLAEEMVLYCHGPQEKQTFEEDA